MGQDQKEVPGPSATVRAEQLLDRFGQRIGLFAALAGQRIQNAAASIREEADKMDQPETVPAEKPGQPTARSTAARTEAPNQIATVKAEEMVDRMGQRASHLAARTSLQIQRATSRVREETEDIWAEAQHIRHQNGRKM